jgi:hypothetical protein
MVQHFPISFETKARLQQNALVDEHGGGTAYDSGIPACSILL